MHSSTSALDVSLHVPATSLQEKEPPAPALRENQTPVVQLVAYSLYWLS